MKCIRIQKGMDIVQKQNKLKYYAQLILKKILVRDNNRIVLDIMESNMFRTYVWAIPVEYASSLIFDQSIGFNRFNNYNDYLSYRYGDWRTPVSHWSFDVDDGGIRPADANTVNTLYHN